MTAIENLQSLLAYTHNIDTTTTTTTTIIITSTSTTLTITTAIHHYDIHHYDVKTDGSTSVQDSYSKTSLAMLDSDMCLLNGSLCLHDAFGANDNGRNVLDPQHHVFSTVLFVGFLS